MARKKVITRQQILDAAYDLVAQEGFQKFTARNIAQHMACSTQPIYLEFRNMDELKEAVFDRIHDYLGEEIFTKAITGDNVVDMGLNYIYFAKHENKLYKALYLEDYGGGERMHSFSYTMFSQRARKDEHYANLPEDVINRLHTGTWITVTGLASLMSSNIIHPTQEQMIAIIQDSIGTILDKEEAVGA
ncbi:TetR/AcrR family transcriptional regulator [Enterococcus nangangensis]|uniref:TetR/AcrR family transcriptional regulator n=1 Tax=Enterococcus nangangensis TaxID=2559926 RepID=UPI0010F58DBB|nr:TetR/AcrR family transcriptional regulator [Enterococcus nangangensis]